MEFLEKEKLEGLANEGGMRAESGGESRRKEQIEDEEREKEDVCVIIALALKQTGGL